MGWVIFWVLCGVVSAIIGGNRGRSAFGWFLFGCLVGPFAMLLALMASTQTQAELDAAGHAPWWANAWLVNTSPPPKTEGDWHDWQLVHLHPRVNVARLVGALQEIGLALGDVQDRGLCIVPADKAIPPAPYD